MTYLASSFFKRKKDAEKEFIKELNKFDEQLNYMDRVRLIELGREFILNKDYIRIKHLYSRLKKYPESSEYAELCLEMNQIEEDFRKLIHPWSDILQSKRILFFRGLENFIEKPDVIGRVKSCLNKTKQIHSEGKIQREDILSVNVILDRIPFTELEIPDRPSFIQSYETFKEYIFQNT